MWRENGLEDEKRLKARKCLGVEVALEMPLFVKTEAGRPEDVGSRRKGNKIRSQDMAWIYLRNMFH